MTRIRSAALLLALLTPVFGGCELTSVEIATPEDVVVAEVVLRTDTPHQRAFLYRTLSGSGVGSSRVDSARVRIVSEDGLRSLPLLQLATPFPCLEDAALVPDSVQGSCYASTPVGGEEGFIQPGRRYQLEIELPDGRRLDGTTTVPGAFEIVRPAITPCRADAPILLVWTRSEGAWSYQAAADFSNLAPGLRALGVAEPPDELTLTGVSIGVADTTLAFPNEFGVFERFSVDRDLLLALQRGLPEGGRADIVLAAGDRNYVNWVRGGNFNPSGQIRVPSITGDGTGVFGSLAVTGLTVVNDGSATMPGCE